VHSQIWSDLAFWDGMGRRRINTPPFSSSSRVCGRVPGREVACPDGSSEWLVQTHAEPGLRSECCFAPTSPRMPSFLLL